MAISTSLRNVSGPCQCEWRKQDRVHEPARTGTNLEFVFLYLISDSAPQVRCRLDSNKSSTAYSLKAEEHRVTCIAHDADIATDRHNPIIDCS